MLIQRRFDYQPLLRFTDNGIRKYNTPDGKKLVSVTTVLSGTKDLSHLNEWRERVGAAEAAKTVNDASSLGSGMHKNLENYVFGQHLSGSYMAQALAKVIIKNGLVNVSEVWGAEVALYSKELYAGTTDLVGQMINKKSAIIDFKNSIREKKKEWIEDYFLQGCAYKLAHDEMYGTDIDQIIIMVATREAKYQEFVIEGNELETYTYKWLKRLEQYYASL